MSSGMDGGPAVPDAPGCVYMTQEHLYPGPLSQNLWGWRYSPVHRLFPGILMKLRKCLQGKIPRKADLCNHSGPFRGFHFLGGFVLRTQSSAGCWLPVGGSRSRGSIREAAFSAVLTWGQNAQTFILVLSPTSTVTLEKVI